MVNSLRTIVLWTILIVISSLFLVSGAADPQYGLNMIAKAGRGVCWVEKLHKLYPINEYGTNWGTCHSNMNFESNKYASLLKKQEDHIRGQNADPDDHRDMINNSIMTSLKKAIRMKLKKLPPAYQPCNSLVDKESASPKKDYSSILKDQSGGAYPWKALAHCLLEKMESENGAEGVSALKKNMASPPSFHKAIITRENENRARHGVPALKPDAELNTRAQRYAEELARKCKMEHMSTVYGKDYHELQYKGGKTGENLAENGVIVASDADYGVTAANNWYSEIKDYPWPQFTGKNNRGVIGHFTASVWKSTKLAGYGIAKRSGCNKVFIVARYSPGGNIQSPGMPHYKDNVLPPIA